MEAGSYSVKVRWTTNGAGWGTIAVTREILEASQGWNNGNVVGDIGQLTNSSTEYIYVRGGGKYVFRVKNASGVPVLRSTGYTIDQQTVSPKTSVTFPVARLTKIDANGSTPEPLQPARSTQPTVISLRVKSVDSLFTDTKCLHTIIQKMVI